MSFCPRLPLAAAAGLALTALALSACSPSGALSLEPEVDIGVQTTALAPRPTVQAMAPASPMMSYPTLYPTFEPPTEPAYVAPLNPMTQSDVDCRRELKRYDVAFTELDPIDAGGACKVDHPVSVKAIGSVTMKPAATLSCAMALAVARWTKKELIPSARSRYLTGVKTIHQASSYSCRNIAGSRTASEHSKGNALDISRIELNNGRDIEIEKPGLFAFRTRSLLNNVRADACQYFTTVLGPGYNHDHRNHFHFDIMARRNGYVACK